MRSWVGLFNVLFSVVIGYFVYRLTQGDLKFSILCFFLTYIGEGISDLYRKPH